MSIRKYSESDYSSLLDIYSNSKLDELRFESTIFQLLPLEKDKVRSALIHESDIYVYGEEEVVAFCAYYGSEIRALFVHPKARRKGVGVKLLEFMLSNIIGLATLYVASSNSPAILLYRKYGFDITSEFKTSYNGEAVLASKMVTNGSYG